MDRERYAGRKTTGKVFLHPTIAVEPEGSIDLVFYAGQDEGDPAGAFWRRRWSAGVFAPSQIVGTPITYELNRATSNWLGDYVGLVVSGGALHAAYADNSSGDSHIAFARVAVPQRSDLEPLVAPVQSSAESLSIIDGELVVVVSDFRNGKVELFAWADFAPGAAG